MTRATAAPGVALAAVRLSDVDLALAESLDEAEHSRAAAFRSAAQRHRFLAGRIALRLHISELTGLVPSSLKPCYSCPSCRNHRGPGHGAPQYQLPSGDTAVRASLSRSGDWCLLAVTFDDNITGIGVDIEEKSRAGFGGFDSVALTANERDQLEGGPATAAAASRTRLWVRKEAVLKALGTGLATDPALVDVSGATPRIPGQPPSRHRWLLQDLNAGNLGLPEGMAAALAVRYSSSQARLPRRSGNGPGSSPAAA